MSESEWARKLRETAQKLARPGYGVVLSQDFVDAWCAEIQRKDAERQAAKKERALMGIEYKLINERMRERVEPGQLGQGAIHGHTNAYGIVNGPAARLFAWLHLWKDDGWRIINDCGDLYYDCKVEGDPAFCKDMTEQYRLEFNAGLDGDDEPIVRCA